MDDEVTQRRTTRPKRLPRHVGRLLCAALATGHRAVPDDAFVALAARADLSLLPEGAHYHGVTGYLLRRLRGVPGLDEHVGGQLRAFYHDALRRHLMVTADLRDVGELLDGEDIPWLVTKGPVLAEAVHGRPDLRSYADLDIVVPPAELPAAIASMEAAGWELIDRNWLLLRQEMRGELHVRLPHGSVADVHWHLVNDSRTRSHFPVPMCELFSRARHVVVADQMVPTSGVEDTILHLALHTVLSGGHRLMWYKDLERVIATAPVDWDTLTDRAARWNASLPLAVALQGAHSLIGAAVPRGSLRLTRGARTWATAVAAARVLSSPTRSFGYGSVTRITSRSTRTDLPSSLREFARRSSARRVPRRGHRARDGTPLPATDAGSLSFSSGDKTDRAAFYAAVADESQVRCRT